MALPDLRCRRGIVNPLAATYDGDTPQGSRARLRKQARVLLTNPDMLHAGILPNHPLWAEFFRHLRYDVIDEAHTYRGVFGSQVACVLRRLRRVCAIYQNGDPTRRTRASVLRSAGTRRYSATTDAPWTARIGHSSAEDYRTSVDPVRGGGVSGPAGPQFIATSATIANPGEHFTLLTGLPVTVVTDDGSPHGPRTFALWNPPFIDKARTSRRSANHEAGTCSRSSVGGVRTIAFAARAWSVASAAYSRNNWPRLGPGCRAVAAGVTPAHRIAVVRGRLLRRRRPLELGIDVGGFRRIAAGRLSGHDRFHVAAGVCRTVRPVSGTHRPDNPLDQYYMRHRTSCWANHADKRCSTGQRLHPPASRRAQARIALAGGRRRAEEALFAPALSRHGAVGARRKLRYTGEKWVYTAGDYPAQDVNLRDAEGDRFAVLDAGNTYKMIEELSATTAPQRVHPGAVYLHQGDSYLVTEFNYDLRHAVVQQTPVDYYTQPRELNDVRIVRFLKHREPRPFRALGRGVRSRVIGYAASSISDRSGAGRRAVDMP